MTRTVPGLPAVALLVGFLALYPLGWLIYGSLSTGAPFQAGSFTWGNYARAYGDPQVAATVWNTLVFAAGQMAVAVACAVILGWITTRTNTPGRRVFEVLLAVVFLLPLILGVLAWSMLLSPQKGLVNQLLMQSFGLARAPFDIYSMAGMIFVQGIYVTPLAFLIVAPAFRSIDSSLEEAARMSGCGQVETFLRVSLPLAMPAILSAALLLFVIGIESFDIPQLLGAPVGIFTYTSLIYGAVASRYPADFGLGTALAVSLLAVSALCVLAYRRATARAERFETVRGKSYGVQIIDLGRWRWLAAAVAWGFFALTVLLPMAVLGFGSLLRFYGRFDMGVFGRMTLENYGKVFAYPRIWEALGNSLMLAAVSAVICVFLAATVAYIAIKTRMRGRVLVEVLAMLPISFPATVLALGLLWGYVAIPLPIYGTLAILAIAFVTRYLPIGLRAVSGGMIQLGAELEEAARMSGASWLQIQAAIMLPLLRPVLIASGVILFMIFLRELGMSILLAGIDNPVLSVVMYDYYESGELGLLSALAVLLLGGVVAVVLLVRALFGIRLLEHGR